MRAFFYILFISTLIICTVSPAWATPLSPCEGHLIPANYRMGKQLVLDPDVSVLSLEPERLSLEDRHPGIARKIFAVMNGRMPFFRWPHAHPMGDEDSSKIFNDLYQVTQDLRAVGVQFRLSAEDQARFVDVSSSLAALVQNFAQKHDPFLLTSQKIGYLSDLIRRMQSALFDLMVSAFFDGERFWFHQSAADFYLGPRVMQSGRIKGRNGDHEIDLIIQRRNGRHLWVEAKNNSMDWSLEDYARWQGIAVSALPFNIREFHQDYMYSRSFGSTQQVIVQLESQSALAQRIGRGETTDILLFSKYPFPASLQTEIQRLGIATRALFPSNQAFLPQYFEAISRQIDATY